MIKLKEFSKWFNFDFETSAIIILSVVIIFTAFIMLTRISGLRTFAKMTSFDFATTIAIGSILASIALNPKTTIGNGFICLIAIVTFQILFAFIQRKSEGFRTIATNEPVLLMRDGEIDYNALSKVNLHKSELIAKLREANVLDFGEVRAVVFESTGDVSVLHSSNKDVQLSEKLLDFLD